MQFFLLHIIEGKALCSFNVNRVIDSYPERMIGVSCFAMLAECGIPMDRMVVIARKKPGESFRRTRNIRRDISKK